jgi:hypothetical protein
MNAPRTIRTIVVTIDADDLDTPPTNHGIQQARFRPSDLVPWSDPYIASLVRQLQDEVRESRETPARRLGNEAEMPWNEPFEHFEDDEPAFSIDPDNLFVR